MMASNERISSEEIFDGFSRVLIRTCQRNILYVNTKTPTYVASLLSSAKIFIIYQYHEV